jgi:hypothetical protein
MCALPGWKATRAIHPKLRSDILQEKMSGNEH